MFSPSQYLLKQTWKMASMADAAKTLTQKSNINTDDHMQQFVLYLVTYCAGRMSMMDIPVSLSPLRIV